MRTFIAIELPENIKGALAGIQDKLRTSGADVKWVEPKNIHLTLKFLGERDDKKIKKIEEIIEETAKNYNIFSCKISTLGAFPKIKYPRVIWVGIEEKADTQTKNIAQELEEKIAKIGIPKENRPFSSHITIARIRSGLKRQELVKNIESMQSDIQKLGLEFQVKKITLFKSTLTPKGPIYEVLKEANLKTT